MEQIIVIVIAPSRKPEKALLNTFNVDTNNWACVGMNKEGQECEKGSYNSLLFMLINQCQKTKDIKGKLNEIYALNKNVIVYTHQNADGTHQPFPSDSIITIFNEKIIDCISFSHSDKGDKPIEKFMSSVNSSWEERKKILQQIIDDCIKKKATSDTHSLRSQILTPFVALHLTLEDSFNERENPKDNPLIFDKECKDECKKCCNDIKNKGEILNKFLENVPEKQKEEIKTKYSKLKVKIDGLYKEIEGNNGDKLVNFKDLFEGETSGYGLIGDFADKLEIVVEQVEKASKSK